MERGRIYLRILNIVFIDLFYFVICATRKVFFYTVIQLLDCFSSAGVRKKKQKTHNEWMSDLQNIAQPKEPQHNPVSERFPTKGARMGVSGEQVMETISRGSGLNLVPQV